MSQSLVQLPVHIVFSTAGRRPFLAEPATREELIFYLHGLCRNLDCPAIRINGPDNHLHLLVRLNREMPIKNLIRTLKANSSKWMHDRFPDQRDFKWQKGYGLFGVSPSAVQRVVRYIENQEAHHRKFSFEDEFRAICTEAGLVIDERFVWE